MHKNIFLLVLAGCALTQSAFAASTMTPSSGEGDGAVIAKAVSSASISMVSVLTDADRRLVALYPQTYKDHDNINLPVEIREIVRTFGLYPKGQIRTAKQRALVDKMVHWYADKGLEYLASLPDSEHKAALQAQLTEIKESPFENINRYLIVRTISRVLAFASQGRETDPAMRDVFEHLEAKDLFALHETVDGRPAWMHSDLMIAVLEDADSTPSKERKWITRHYLPPVAHKLFKAEKHKYFDRKMYVPMLGTAKFGLTMLVRAWLRDIYPIAMPVNASRAHGAVLPPDYFAFHDKFHSREDRRKKAVLEWGRKVLIDTSTTHEDLYTFKTMVPEVVQMAKHRFDLLNLVFDRLIDEVATECATKLEIAATDADKRAAKQEYNKTLAAIFYILHEAAAGFDPEIFDQKGPLEMLDFIVKHSARISNNETDTDKNPVFVNYSGVRVKTDEEIRAWVTPKVKDLLPSYAGAVENIAINETPAYINIHITSKTGYEANLDIPSKSIQLRILEDDAALLRLAGVAVAPIVGDVGTSAYEISAQNHVNSIVTGINGLLQNLMTTYLTKLHSKLIDASGAPLDPVVKAVMDDNARLADGYKYTFGVSNTASAAAVMPVAPAADGHV